MLKNYALKIDGVEFRTHEGIFAIKDKIIALHFALGVISQEEHASGIRPPRYVICDIFSPDFTQHEQLTTILKTPELTDPHEAVCYEQEGKIFINTKKISALE